MAQKDDKSPVDHLVSFFSAAAALEPFAFLANTLPQYLKTAIHVVAKGPRFGQVELRVKNSKVPGTAVAFYLCGIAFSLLLLRPTLRRTDLRFDWILFILESVYLQLLMLLVIYLAAKVGKGKGTFVQTLRAYGYWLGLVLPFVVILHYAAYWFSKSHSLPRRAHFRLADFSLVIPDWRGWWIWASYGVITLLVLLFAWRWLLQWLCDIHRIRRQRILALVLSLLIPVIYLQVVVFQPHVTRVLGSTAGYLRSWNQWLP